MISAVLPPDLGPAAATAARAAREPSAEDVALTRACRELEAVFLRQLLEASKIGEQGGRSGYGPMVVDALASALTDAGGIGLGENIKAALSAHDRPESSPATTSDATKAIRPEGSE
ncbi:MAG: hypothetical protein U0271_31940 [Polyangiaceae bacterium]